MRSSALIYIIMVFIFCLSEAIQAQVIISKPNFAFAPACASPLYNTFKVTFSFSNEAALGLTNKFIAELSDNKGSFSNPTIIYTSEADSEKTSPVTFNFSLPTSASGESYVIRIKGTAPETISQSSKSFAAYYKAHDSPFSINNLIETGVYCNGGSYLLTIDNLDLFSNNSPLKYSSLTFKWYKETGSITSDFAFVSDGETLSVNEPGTYFVNTNYGTCTSVSTSNRVTISALDFSIASNINSSLGNPYCASEGQTTLSAIKAKGYQWFKDGDIIVGATKQMYKTDESGEYSVNIDLGSCMTDASINLDATGFTSSIDMDEVNYIDQDETQLATITTSANSPEYKWYLNNSLISGATAKSYIIQQVGNYKVIVTQTMGCNASNSFSFEVRSVFPGVEKIPNLISPNGDGNNDTWVIPKKYSIGSNSEIVILNAQGKIQLKTKNYQNNWPDKQLDLGSMSSIYYYIITVQNGKTKKGTITVVK